MLMILSGAMLSILAKLCAAILFKQEEVWHEVISAGFSCKRRRRLLLNLVLLITISGCASYTYKWEAPAPGVAEKARGLVAAPITPDTFTQLRAVLLAENPSIKALRMRIEIAKHTTGNVADYIPHISASYNLLEKEPYLSLKNVIEPLIKAVFEKSDLTVEELRCSLKVLEHTMVSQLTVHLDELHFCRIRLAELKNELADKKAWYLYHTMLQEYGLLDDWESKLQISKQQVIKTEQEIAEMLSSILRIKRSILSLCGVTYGQDNCDD